MSGALLLLVMNFIGLGLGPTYVGAASDYFRVNGFLRTRCCRSRSTTLTPFYVFAIILFVAGAR
ncbi:MAG: hypothetical protein R3C16_08340 [Hyphomonadaceae bacterium]